MAESWPSNVSAEFRRWLISKKVTPAKWNNVTQSWRSSKRQEFSGYQKESTKSDTRRGMEGVGFNPFVTDRGSEGSAGSGKKTDRSPERKKQLAPAQKTAEQKQDEARAYRSSHNNGYTEIRRVTRGDPLGDAIIKNARARNIGPYDPRVERLIESAKIQYATMVSERTNIPLDQAKYQILTHHGTMPKGGEGFVGTDYGPDRRSTADDKDRFRSMAWLVGQGYTWSTTQIKDLQSKLADAGFGGLTTDDVTGHFDAPTIAGYHELLMRAHDERKTPSEVLAEFRGVGKAAEDKKKKIPPFVPAVKTQMNEKDIKTMAESVGYTMTGRTPSKAELAAIIKQVRGGEESEWAARNKQDLQQHQATYYNEKPGPTPVAVNAPSTESVSRDIFDKSEEGLNWSILQGISQLSKI